MKTKWQLAALMLMVCGTIQAAEEPKSPAAANVSKPVEDRPRGNQETNGIVAW